MQIQKNRITGDCIYRALCAAMNIPYNQVVMDLAELQCKTGYADEKLYGRYLELNGWIKHNKDYGKRLISINRS